MCCGKAVVISGKSTDGPVSKYLNRRVSTLITSAIVKYRVPLTPNQVSIISFLMGLAASWLYVIGSNIAAAVVLQLSSIVDGVDGELARALGMCSRFGAFLDAMLDRFVDIAIIASVTYVALATGASPTYALLAGLAALSGDLLVSYIHARGEASLGAHPAKMGRVPSFASRDVRLFAIFVATLLGLYLPALIITSVLSYAYVVSKLLDVALTIRSPGVMGREA